MGQSFYDELRTKQQFGYLVSSSRNRIQKNYYIQQKIQSTKDIELIEKAILKFNENFLNNLSEEDFNKYLLTAKKILEERQTTTRELFNNYSIEIIENEFEFERYKLLLKHIDKIDFSMLKKFYTDNILNKTPIKMYIRSKK